MVLAKLPDTTFVEMALIVRFLFYHMILKEDHNKTNL